MPKRFAREFRRAVCERLVAGEKVIDVSVTQLRIVADVSSAATLGPRNVLVATDIGMGFCDSCLTVDP